MRKVLLAFVLLAAGVQADAFSGTSATMLRAGCYTSVNVSSGSAYKGTNDFDCRCIDEVYNGNAIAVSVTTSSCAGFPWYNAGTTLEGKNCCAKSARLTDVELSEDVVQFEKSHDLESVYQPKQDFTTSYAGYLNSVLRSPVGGRGSDPLAKLDICLGDSTVTNLGTGSTGYSNCVNACQGGSNGYCTNSMYNNGSLQTAGACIDRCECQFGMGGTCESL